MRKYASAEERAAKNQKTTVRHFDFTEKVYGLPFSTTQHYNTVHNLYIINYMSLVGHTLNRLKTDLYRMGCAQEVVPY